MIHASVPAERYASDAVKLAEADRILRMVSQNRAIDADINRALNLIASALAKLM